jgi:hypothetical protein
MAVVNEELERAIGATSALAVASVPTGRRPGAPPSMPPVLPWPAGTRTAVVARGSETDSQLTATLSIARRGRPRRRRQRRAPLKRRRRAASSRSRKRADLRLLRACAAPTSSARSRATALSGRTCSAPSRVVVHGAKAPCSSSGEARRASSVVRRLRRLGARARRGHFVAKLAPSPARVTLLTIAEPVRSPQ